MPQGRPRKPTALKQLQGTYRPDRANASEAFPDAPLSLDPPPFLSGRAKDKWHDVAPMLARNGLLTEADTDTLGVYCQTWARYVEAEQS